LLLSEFFYPLVRYDPAILDHAALDEAASTMATLATMLDDRLGEGPFISGDDFTYADIIVGTVLYRYYELEFLRTSTPNIDRYYERLMSREAYKTHVMVSYEPLRWKPAE
jgi:glutathione S-transferase